MKIAILGGTGHLGRLLAQGWTRAGHTVSLGSRNPAETAAKVSDWTFPVSVVSHAEAVAGSALVVFSIPAAAVDEVAPTVAPLLAADAVVLSVMVPLVPGEPTRFDAPREGSIAEHLQSLLPKDLKIVAAFHTVSAQTSNEEGDALVCGSDAQAREFVVARAKELGLRPVDCGPLRMAQTLERLTPLLIGINRRYRVHGAGIRVTGLG